MRYKYEAMDSDNRDPLNQLTRVADEQPHERVGTRYEIACHKIMAGGA